MAMNKAKPPGMRQIPGLHQLNCKDNAKAIRKIKSIQEWS